MNDSAPDDRPPDDQTTDRWRHYRSKSRFLGLAPDSGLSYTCAPQTRYYVVDLSPETGEPFIFMETTDLDQAFSAAGHGSHWKALFDPGHDEEACEWTDECHRHFAVLSREEALADEVGRRLLARWKAEDDAAWERSVQADLAMAKLQEEIERDQGLIE